MEADITLTLSDEQVQEIIKNKDFLELFVHEVVCGFKHDMGCWRSGYWRNEILDKITTGVATKLIEDKIDEIAKTIDKRINVLVANKLSNEIQKSIIKSLEERGE